MSMMRKVVGIISAGYMGMLLLWVVLPLFASVYNTMIGWRAIDVDDPNIQQMFANGTLVFVILGGVVLFVLAWTFISYATGGDPRDRII